ncbi:MAG: hypothetical protein ACI82A_003833 [Candidatus Azotimanducaceae bacterium]|jgi:hypothetical protein
MKFVKIFGVLVLAYIGLVVAFESWLGYYQPENTGTLIITTTDADDNRYDRVLARIESQNKVYVAVNHWPRAWYYRLLDEPEVKITYNKSTIEAVAIPVSGAEFEQVNNEHSLPMFFRVLTGFPPRRLLRLDPAAS